MVKKLKKQYETPNEGWSEERIQREDQLVEEYGLKNKKEVYKAESMLRDLRREARKLVAQEDEEQNQNLINKAQSLGLVKKDAQLEDILTLNTTDILDRRLQTAVNRRGYSDTVNEARQLVTHGHTEIDGKRVNIPGYLLTQEEEKKLEVELPEPDEETETEEVEEQEETAEEPEETEESEEAEENESGDENKEGDEE
ncbi:MAG: small subunit ribosomal protein S4 [Candidatus Nanohaloarchaea archaeon]|jgi:small subunit ribosomal protein S4